MAKDWRLLIDADDEDEDEKEKIIQREDEPTFIVEVYPASSVGIAENDQDRRSWPEHLSSS